jgi:hypothetical protein
VFDFDGTPGDNFTVFYSDVLPDNRARVSGGTVPVEAT